MENCIGPEVLERFIEKFWGYGEFSAPIWMIGMEESCGKTRGEFKNRIVAWRDRGAHLLEDAKDYHERFLGKGKTGLFENSAKLQRTWAKLSRTYLAAYGCETGPRSVHRFQKTILGRRNSVDALQTCFMELMPLPSPTTSVWDKQLKESGIDYLQNRKLYLAEVAPKRVKRLQCRIADYRPEAVVFYGDSYKGYWSRIIEGCARPFVALDDEPRICRTESEHTVFYAVPHPTARNGACSRNADFVRIGQELNGRLFSTGRLRP